jgi:hypothetical protein
MSCPHSQRVSLSWHGGDAKDFSVIIGYVKLTGEIENDY